MKFSSIIGQEAIKQLLVNTVHNNHISHAQLFLGNLGHGGLSLAIAYAQFISCTNKQENDSCGTCSSCIKYEKLIHPDLFFTFPVNKTHNVTEKNPISNHFLNYWREIVLRTNGFFNETQWGQEIGLDNKLGNISVYESAEIIKRLSLKAFESDYKITIIWKPERMNDSASNKLLKLIEEPPKNTLFFLVAEDQEAIIQTILSRTQLVKVNRLSHATLVQALNQQYGIQQDKASAIANISDGSLVEAVKHISINEDDLLIRDKFIQWMRICYKPEIVNMVDWVDDQANLGREKQKLFLQYALHIFREALIMNYATADLLHVEGEEKAWLQKFCPYVNGLNAVELMELYNDSVYKIERNANPKPLFLNLGLKTTKLLRRKA